MGGNAFEDAEPLTPQEYAAITAQIHSAIAGICLRVEPYIPLPEKERHGDVDFLLILQPGHTLSDIRQLLEIPPEHFIENNNGTANSLFRKKQVDFNVAADPLQFMRCRFYKSYGGIGAFLGLFLPSKFVKLNEDGLICCAYHEHVKLEFLVCTDIAQILAFYGLDPQGYEAGFQTRRQLFTYLRELRFLDEEKFLSHTTKHQTKLMKAFQEFLKEEGVRTNPHFTVFEDPCSAVLQYFKQGVEFEEAWKARLSAETRKKELQAKWNGMHIMNIFKIDSKMVNSLKKKFETTFPDRAEYEAYILRTPFHEIITFFGEVCNLPQTQETL